MKLIFDIGANAGDYTGDFTNWADTVVAFEPNPNLLPNLHKRFSGTNVIVDRRALSSEIGTKQFMISDAATLSTFSQEWKNSGRFSQGNCWEIPIEVMTTTIDQAIIDYGIPDFIKIDVEGYEYEVLKGLTQCLPDTIISFEWAEEDIWISDAITYLQSLGYTKFVSTDGDIPLVNDVLLWADWDPEKFFADINPSRMERWGMIYFKKDFWPGDNRLMDNQPINWERDVYVEYINLPSRSDRNDKMIKELDRVGIKAIRRIGLLPEQVNQPADKLWAMQNRTPGAIGCHYSQVATMEEALRLGKHAWVQEDDLIYCSDLQERLVHIGEFLDTHEWDIFWLGGTYHKEPTWHHSVNGQHTHPDLQMCKCELNRDWEPTDDPQIVRTYGAWSTYSYIVNKKRIKHILDLLDQNVYRSMGIDWLMILLQPNLHTYAFNPGCCRQYNNQSNIGTGITNFDGFQTLGPHWFKDTL